MDLYHKLRKVGLTKYEAKIYITLLEYGKINARQLAKYSLVPPTAVYPGVKTLINKGLIQKFEGEVRLFGALKPEIAINTLIEEKHKELNSIKTNLITESESIVNQKTIEKTREVLSISLGNEASSSVHKEMMKQTKKTYYVMGWRLFKVGRTLTFLHEYKEMMKKGIEIRIILTGENPKKWSVIQEYVKAKIPIRYYSLENFSIVIADGKECKISLKSLDLPSKYNMHIQDPNLSEAMQMYYLSIWKKSKDVKTLKAQAI